MRGVMVALFAYWVNIGSIMGAAVDNKTKERMDELSYRIPLACLYAVPTVLAGALFFVPESPRWLLHRGKEIEARKALEMLRGRSYAQLRTFSGESEGEVGPSLLEIEWAEMVKGVEEEKRTEGDVAALDMFRGTTPFPLISLPTVLIYLCRSRPPPNPPLLRHDRLPNRLRRVVPNRLPDLLLHGNRHSQSIRILHHEHLLRLPGREYRDVRHPRARWPPLNPHHRGDRVRTVSAWKCDRGKR